MDMTPQTAWLIAISAVVIAGVVAFFIGRSTAGTKARIDELEAELRGKQQEVEAYRKDVEAHFDKTATLFVSMAGSYKELFQHLSSGYETLSSGSARTLFQQRVDALLVGSAREDGSKLLAAGALAGAAATAAAAGVAAEAAGEAGVTAAADVQPADRAVESAVAPSATDEPDVPAFEPVAAQGELNHAEATPERADEGASQAVESASTRAQAVAAEPAAADSVVDDADEIVRRAEGGGFDPDATASPTPGERADAR